MLKCIELDERLKAMDQEITVNPQFVQKVNRVLLVGNRWGRRDITTLRTWFHLLNSCSLLLKTSTHKFTEVLGQICQDLPVSVAWEGPHCLLQGGFPARETG